MYQHFSTHRTTEELLGLIIAQSDRIAALEAENEILRWSHLGILGPAAIRQELQLVRGRRDLICIDFRKLHDWDELIGHDAMDMYLSAFVQARQLDTPGYPTRAHDLRGQWKGDEFVIATEVGDGLGLMHRLVEKLDELTAGLAPELIAAISARTGGLVAGFAAVFVLVPNSDNLLLDATRGIDMTGVLKRGRITGSRSTSGAEGTIIGTLVPYGGAA